MFAARIAGNEYLARYKLAGLFLDTLPYNGHATASDALRAGLPLITCLGSSFAGRVAASLLEAVGLPELITHSREDYEALAVRLAEPPAELARLGNRLVANCATQALFDTDRFRRNIEAAYREMHRRQQAGEAPADFTVRGQLRAGGSSPASVRRLLVETPEKGLCVEASGWGDRRGIRGAIAGGRTRQRDGGHWRRAEA